MLALKTGTALQAAAISEPVTADIFFPALVAALQAGSGSPDFAYAYFELGGAGE